MDKATDVERREIARIVTTVLVGVVLMATFGFASLGGFLYCIYTALVGEEAGERVMAGILAVLAIFIYVTGASIHAMKGRSGGVLMGFVPLLVFSPL